MFKPSVFSAVLIALSGLVTAMPTDKPSLGAIPAGSPNGFYAGHLKDDGSTQWELLIAHPEETTSNIEDPIVKSSLTKRDGFSCNGFAVNANDVAVAQTQFAANCGVSGYTFTAHAIAYTYSSGVAYGCNYAKSQTCYHDGVTNAFNLLSSEHCRAFGSMFLVLSSFVTVIHVGLHVTLLDSGTINKPNLRFAPVEPYLGTTNA